MHTFKIFYAITTCDADWIPLGDVQADSKKEALEKAAQRWKEYARSDLVILSESEAATGVIVTV